MNLELTIGQKLRELRRLRRLGLKALAVRLGIHPSYISRVENGHIDPAPAHIRPWADALGADADVLFYAFGRVPPDLKSILANNPLKARDVRALVKD